MRPVRLSRRGVLLGAITAAAGWTVSGSRAPSRGVDLIVHGGRVHTLDRRFGVAECVAIHDGLVVAVGSEQQVRPLAGSATQLLDAGGGTVMPGINDSHLHLSSFGLTFPPYSVDVDAASIDELVGRVAGAARADPPSGWVRGRGWNETRLPRAPTRADLDPVSGGRPVVLTDFSLHAVAVNTVVLERAGVTRDTVPPAGGVIEKDPNGEPTGVLREGAQALIHAVVPPYSRDEQAAAIDRAIGVLHARGVTSITEPGITADLLELYADKARAAALPMRLTALLQAGASPTSLREVLAAHRPPEDVDLRNLRVTGVKIFADGIPTAARTAWLRRPYLDGSNGGLTIDGAHLDEQIANLHEMIQLAHHAGLQVGTHATGDATIDTVVTGYLAAIGTAPGAATGAAQPNRNRHYVIHADLAPAATLQLMGEHHIAANMNPQIKYLIDRTLEPLLGPERVDWHWPYRTALDHTVAVSSGSDAPVTDPDWRQGVMTAILRTGRLGNIAGPTERITLPEALRTYTSTPAWQDFAEDWKGTLEPGRVADLCILAADITEIAPHELPDIPVVATVLDGQVVHDAAAHRDTSSHGLACDPGGGCCCTLNDAIRTGQV